MFERRLNTESKRLSASFVLSLVLNTIFLGLAGWLWTPRVTLPTPTYRTIRIKMITLPETKPPAAPKPRARPRPATPLPPSSASSAKSARRQAAEAAPHRVRVAAAASLVSKPTPHVVSQPVPSVSVTNAPPIPDPRPSPASHASIVRVAAAIQTSKAGKIMMPVTGTPTGKTAAAPSIANTTQPGTPPAGSDKGEGAAAPPSTGNGDRVASNAGVGGGLGNGAGSGQGAGQGGGSGSGGGTGDGPFGIGTGIGQGGGPRHIVYLLDVSLSMPTRIAKAKSELHEALSGLGRDESFDIVTFAGDTQPFEHSLVPVSRGAIARANKFLDDAQLRPSTDLQGAIFEALGMNGVNVIVVITDGVPTVGETDFDRLAQHIRARNSGHARIYTIGLVGKDPDGRDDTFEATKLLTQIAHDSGGEFKYVQLGKTVD